MADQPFRCTLCCKENFDSKKELIEHLTSIESNIECPICNARISSLTDLIEHLNNEDCSYGYCNTDVHIENSKISENTNSLESKIVILNTNGVYSSHHSNSEANNMFIDMLDKNQEGSCLQSQELKLNISEAGDGYYVLSTEEKSFNEDTILSKQNSDGTVSLFTLKDEAHDTHYLEKNSAKTSQDKLYNCITCGVSFDSVSEHILSHHQNEDVVVEELEDPTPQTQPDEDDKQSKRMITDTGVIVETCDNLYAPHENTAELSINVDHQYENKCPQKKVAKKQRKPLKKNHELKLPLACHKVTMIEETMENGSIKNMYKCVLCNVSLDSLDLFKTLNCKTLKKGKKVIACNICNLKFFPEHDMASHLSTAHGIIDAKESDLLGSSEKEDDAKIFNNIKNDAPPIYKCETCNTQFPTNKSLKLHRRMHDPIKVREIEAVEAESDDEGGNEKFECGECGAVLAARFRAEHAAAHAPDPRPTCAVCNRKFPSHTFLFMHMNVHNTEKLPANKDDKHLPYQCVYCTKRFARPHEKVKHERIHTGERPHSCQICGKSFRVSYCLTLHMRTHTGARPYACKHCGKRFKAHSVYNHHLLTHSAARNYKCPYCPKAFKTAVQLAGHRNSHTKPFSCEHCNRPFASLYAVRVHTETHLRHNNLKYACEACGATYARGFALNDHIKQAHPDLQHKDKNKKAWSVHNKSNGDPLKTAIIQDKNEKVWSFHNKSNEDPLKATIIQDKNEKVWSVHNESDDNPIKATIIQVYQDSNLTIV